jgi:hypothetical protein
MGISRSSRSVAVRGLYWALITAAASVYSLATDADTQEASAFKNDLSRSAVTRMPVYNVDESNSAKTHTLFMGADIAINLDRDMYRVNDVMGSNWVVQINGRDRVISAREAPLNLKITPNLKLTEVSATIVGFRRIQAYSYANDPSVLLTRGLSRSSALSTDLLAVAQNAQNTQDALQNHALGGASLLAGSDDQFSANAEMTTAQYAFANLYTRGVTPGLIHYPLPSAVVPTSTNTSGYVTSLPGPEQIFANVNQGISVGIAQRGAVSAANQTEMGDEATGKIVSAGMDAMDVAFDIRSGKPLQNPYVVTMTRFRAKGAKPGMVQDMVYAQSLHPIDEHLSHIHFVEEGFPFEYELLDFQLHLYNRGEEVATNIASDRVELTRDEAFEYVKMEYIGAHRRETLPAVPAMGRLPADFRSRLAAGKYRGTIYVRVTKDGMADEAFLDPACSRRAEDPYLDSVVQSLRFKPALDQGKPVQGIASLDLDKLAI